MTKGELPCSVLEEGPVGRPLRSRADWTEHRRRRCDRHDDRAKWQNVNLGRVAANLEEACAIKGWTGGNCTAEGRYLTADYPGVLRERLQAALGGEVLYFNGPLGSQVGPGAAPTWVVDEDHPVGDGLTVPEGAVPLTQCEDRPTYLCRSFAKT